MAEFSRLVITEKGQQLISKIFKGTTGVKFTRISTSSKPYEESALSGLTELENEKQSNPVSGVEKTEKAAVKVVTAFTNSELTEGYYLRAMGLYAEDPDDGEILYGVTAELSGNCYMPPFNGITLSAIDVEMVTAVGNADSISLEVDPAAAVTVEQLNSIKTRVNALEEDMENIEALITPVYVQSKNLVPLTSGEKLAAAFGKIAKAISELISHLADTTKHITAAERSKWNGKTSTTFTRTLNSGTKIGTITVDGTATDVYCENADSKIKTQTDALLKNIIIGATVCFVANGSAIADTQTWTNISVEYFNNSWKLRTFPFTIVPAADAGVPLEIHFSFAINSVHNSDLAAVINRGASMTSGFTVMNGSLADASYITWVKDNGVIECIQRFNNHVLKSGTPVTISTAVTFV